MRSNSSLLQDLRQTLPHLRTQMYFKSALVALSHALEDLVLAGSDAPLVIANFQRERFYRQEINRYRRIGQCTDQVYVLAAPERESGFSINNGLYETIPLDNSDRLTQEWHLIIVGGDYTACLVCREQTTSAAAIDQARRFEGIWGFDNPVGREAARLMLKRVIEYRPELTTKVEQACQRFSLLANPSRPQGRPIPQIVDSSIFGQRLMTYLQASQYKLLKAYRALDAQAKKEQLINVMTAAIRRSLSPETVLQTAIQELGQVFSHCRCILYRCHPSDTQVIIEYEYADASLPPLHGKPWDLTHNPLIQVAMMQERATAIVSAEETPLLQTHSHLKETIQRLQIRSWLLAPIRYQGRILGMVELHHGGLEPYRWSDNDISLVEAIATQAGVALTQAEAYSASESLNEQLKALERTQNNLIKIVGHELRTPLSTIQICLESLASEPDMLLELRQTMLDMALTDSARMRKLIQDFLTLSRLEGGQIQLHPESIQLSEIAALAISGLKVERAANGPTIHLQLPPDLPVLQVDGGGLAEVFAKLLDNACKFTASEGQITVQARIRESASATIQLNDDHQAMLEVTITDTGRGIEPTQLETIFDPFYQEEDSLRRTVGGTGLGLAICRKYIEAMDGTIWAESAGREQGSTFHFTLPIEASLSRQV